MSRTKTINKQFFKRTMKNCRLCGEEDYAVLDVHRIVPGEDGGRYVENNVVCLCANCHRRIHDAKEIVIDRYYPSTAGYLLRIVENGVERFV